ncbi:MAG: DNA repair protein RadA, partial [Acidimicrobiia bacterium]|nr:DNA repair protein RadA [Acidimicrobiia bacterium]
RRSVNGLDPNRVTVLSGVLDKLLGLPVGLCDVFVSAAGGVRINDPAADLAVCVAVASSLTDRAVASDTAWIGEVGLAGEVRDVPHLERRVREASRVGFARVVVPVGSVHTARGAAGDGTAVVAVAEVGEALALLTVGSGTGAHR